MTTGTPTTGFTGTGFTIKSVTITPANQAAAKQEVKITGKLDLFGIPFLAFAWVIADITYPKEPLEVAAPVAHYETIAFGGKFTIDIPNGLDRQGLYSIDILCYLGPTIITPVGFISSAALTLPPFPNVAKWPTISYQVSGVLTSAYTIGTPACPLSIIAGNPIKVVVPVTNTTSEDTEVLVKLQVKEQDKVLFITWNGNLVDTLSDDVTIPAGQMAAVAFNYTETADIGSRDLIVTVYVKSNNNVVGTGEFDGIYNVVKVVAPALIISPSTIKQGGSLAFTLQGFGPDDMVTLANQTAPSTILDSFTADADGSYIGAFNFYGNPGSYTMVATGSSGKTASAMYTVQARNTNYQLVISPDTIPYGGTVYFTVSGFPADTSIAFPSGTVVTNANGVGSGSFLTISPAGTYYLTDLSGYGLRAAYTIVGGPPTTPTLTIDNPYNVAVGGPISFEVSNFAANASVVVSTANGNTVTILTNSVGDQGGTLINNEPAGTYILTAKDNAGHQSQATFTVIAPATVSFQVELVKGVYYMNGNLLTSLPGGNQWNLPGQPPVYSLPVQSWTCQYYDPVTKTLVNAGSLNVAQSASFANVNPGGYIVTTFSSASATTAAIKSSVFTAQNEDVWYFNPYVAESGLGGDMQNFYSALSPTLSDVNNPQQNQALYFTLSNFAANETVGVAVVGGGGVTVEVDSTGYYAGYFIDGDPPGNYYLQATGTVSGATPAVEFTVEGAAVVSFQVFLNGVPYNMNGTVLAAPGFPGTAAISWACQYYDPVTKAFVDSGFHNMPDGASFNNVHSGGYVAVLLSDGTDLTNWIYSCAFGAANGDIWDYDPHYSDQLGGIVKQ